MSEKLRVELASPRYGWLAVTLSYGGQTVAIAASNVLLDSVADLAGAVAGILKGCPSARVLLWEEPATYELAFAARDNGVVLTVRRSPDYPFRDRGAQDVMRLEGAAADVCMPFWRALRQLQTVPPSQYQEGWNFPFPTEKLNEITALIGAGAADIEDGATR